MESEFPKWLDVSEGAEASGSKIIIQMVWVILTHPKHKLFERSFSWENLLISGILQEILSVEIHNAFHLFFFQWIKL